MCPHRTIVDVVFLADFSDGVAVLRFETVLLGLRCFLDVLGYRPLRKHLLQILTVYSCKPGTNVDAWYLTSTNHQIQRIAFNTIDGNSFPNGDILSHLGNTFGNQSQLLFPGFCSLLTCVSHSTSFLAAVEAGECFDDKHLSADSAPSVDFKS